jgi:hypothetical protein
LVLLPPPPLLIVENSNLDYCHFEVLTLPLIFVWVVVKACNFDGEEDNLPKVGDDDEEVPKTYEACDTESSTTGKEVSQDGVELEERIQRFGPHLGSEEKGFLTVWSLHPRL